MFQQGKHRVFILIAGALIGFAVLTSSAHASKCNYPSIQEAYSRSQLVVVGTILREDFSILEKTSASSDTPTKALSFDEIRRWKGGKESIRTVLIKGGRLEDMGIASGKTYLLFLKEKDTDSGLYILKKCESINLSLSAYKAISLLDQMKEAAIYNSNNNRTTYNTLINGELTRENQNNEYKEQRVKELQNLERALKRTKQ